MYNKSGQYKSGFTLAEVLITLGIIGIIAAMTMPTLLQKNRDKELVSRTKRVFADINNSLLLIQQQNGVVGDNSFLFNATDSTNTVVKNLAKTFSGSKVCTVEDTSSKCKQYNYDVKYSTLQADENGNATVGKLLGAKIILSNGAIISVATSGSGCEPTTYTETVTDNLGRPIKNEDGSNKTRPYVSDICGNIAFDVNGPKNPNQFGRDAYWLWVYKNKLEIRETSLKNILTGNEKFEYTNYSKGQSIN